MPEYSSELHKLADVLRKPEGRKSFSSDPQGTMEDAEVDASQIDPGVLDTLVGLSDEEWKVLARVRAKLKEAGVPPDISAEIV